MILSLKDYRSKVLGCWMGKNIGGTIGAPMEWKRQVNDVTFYTQELGGNPLPNDDLDLQLVWLAALEERGIDIDAAALGEYWLLYITPHWAEYGNGKVNLRSGLVPPLSGSLNNPYKDSCGAYIRSEIWACIAPGSPEVAARYAYEDAIVDHGEGEGAYAEVFCAALESAAFVEKDIYKLISIGLSYIPAECGVARAIRYTIAQFEAGKTWRETRDGLLENFRGQGYAWAGISEEDREKGFADGPVGWDVPVNVALVILGWLYSRGDFGQAMCITVNCGEDTDCTAGTLGSIFGIIHGIEAIPQKWIEPIGRSIKTMFLNMGELQGYLPADIDALTARVEKLARQVTLRRCPHIELSEIKPTDLTDLNDRHLFSQDSGSGIYENMGGPVHRFTNFDVLVSYPDGPYVRDGAPARVRVVIKNIYKTPESVNIKWYLDEGWTISPARTGKVFIKAHGGRMEFEAAVQTERVTASVNRLALELSVDGRHTVMLVPVTLLNGNY